MSKRPPSTDSFLSLEGTYRDKLNPRRDPSKPILLPWRYERTPNLSHLLVAFQSDRVFCKVLT